MSEFFDLHVHTTYSDGNQSVAEVVELAAERGLAGLCVTDHNGLWGGDELAVACREKELDFLDGIEVTALQGDVGVHVLGYGRALDLKVLERGLASTINGYRDRVEKMCDLCQREGYDKVVWSGIEAQRAGQERPCYTSLDVVDVLMREHGLRWEEARKLTARDGSCHVPYGDWALSPVEAIELIRRAGGAAVLAHPGTVEYEHDRKVLADLLDRMMKAGLDGVEIDHPFHSEEMREWLGRELAEKDVLITGGSDWHGLGRFGDGDLGRYGAGRKVWQGVGGS